MKESITFLLETETAEALRALARARGNTLSEELRQAVKSHAQQEFEWGITIGSSHGFARLIGGTRNALDGFIETKEKYPAYPEELSFPRFPDARVFERKTEDEYRICFTIVLP